MEPYYEVFFMALTVLIAFVIVYFIFKLNILINLNIKYLKNKLEGMNNKKDSEL